VIRQFRKSKEWEEGTLLEKGFTLIELLIVIVVLGILAATVIFALGGVTGQSAQAACNSDAKSLEVAAEAYHSYPGNATNAYPATVADLVAGVAGSGPFIHAAPNNTHYAITITGGGAAVSVVNVTPTGGTLQAFDSQAAGPPPTGCFAVS
jgi:general secretion pathway protein G